MRVKPECRPDDQACTARERPAKQADVHHPAAAVHGGEHEIVVVRRSLEHRRQSIEVARGVCLDRYDEKVVRGAQESGCKPGAKRSPRPPFRSIRSSSTGSAPL